MIQRLLAILLLAFSPVVHAAPAVDDQVLDQNGKSRRFFSDIVQDKPAVVNFIYTSCEGICPPMGAHFAKLEKELKKRKIKDVRLISISLDPEQDTPAKLKTWVAQWHGQWTLVTGERKHLDAISQTIFGAPLIDKALHNPISVVRTRSGQWVRMDGLGPIKEILAKLEQ